MTTYSQNIRMLMGITSIMAAGTLCQADLIIDVQDGSLLAGGTGYVDVLIHSTGTDAVALASYKFQISYVSGDGDLQFQASSNSLDVLRQLNTEQTFSSIDYNYIFLGDTSAANFAATRQDPDKLLLVGSDFTASSNEVIIGATPLLLTRLELQHITPTPGSSQGTFRISLVEDPANTFFLDDTLNPLSPTPISASSFSSLNSGLITVGTAVPEPSSLTFLCIAAALCCMRRRSPETQKQGWSSRQRHQESVAGWLSLPGETPARSVVGFARADPPLAATFAPPCWVGAASCHVWRH